jgi:hypothetical protein
MTARRNAISAQYYDYNKPGPTAYGSPNRIAFPLHSYQQQRHSQHFAVRTTLLIQSDPAPVPQHSHQASVTARRYSFPSTSRKLPNDIFRHYGNTHQQHKRSTKKKSSAKEDKKAFVIPPHTTIMTYSLSLEQWFLPTAEQ